MFVIKKQFYLAMFLGVLLTALLSACDGNGADEAGDANQASGASQTGDPGQGAAETDEPELAQGVTEDQILVGHLGPQTGPVAIYDGIRKGIDSYFSYVNEQGGVNGRMLELVAYDDQYQPAKTVQLARRLVEEDQVFAMLANVCTPCNTAAKDYYIEQGIPIIMLGSGSSQFVNPPIPNYMGSSIVNYEFEARVLADYAANTLGAERIAIAFQNDDYGSPLAERAAQEIEGFENAQVVQQVNFQAGDADLSAQAQRLKQANPDAILVFSVPAPAAQLKKALYGIGLREPAFIVSSVGGNAKQLFDLAGADVWEGTYSSAVYPMPGQSDDEDIALYSEQFSEDYPNMALADWGQAGWAAAEVFVEALERTDVLTWENFLNSFYTFDNWEGSIYTGVTFSEDNHYGLTSLFITEAQDGNIVPISEPITFDPATGEITLPSEQGENGVEEANGSVEGDGTPEDQAGAESAGSG